MLPDPHPTAQKLLAAAWSLGRPALSPESSLPPPLPAHPSIDPEIDLITADDAFFLRARLNFGVPGLDRDLARELVDAAHGICQYSKATRRDINAMARWRS